jgi:carbon-monoxide dehydrogenase medium subunit
MWWRRYLQPASLDEALDLLTEYAGRARIVAGGTDVVVELSRGVRPTETLIDITRLGELKYVCEEDGELRLGGLATHNDVLATPPCVERALPLAQACAEVGAPQIRTRATVAGNLITASPANDTIPPLLALDTSVVLVSRVGERIVPLRDFYPGFRQTALRPDELLREIRIPAMPTTTRGLFVKLGLRQAQAISVINFALLITLDGDRVTAARIALGSLAPTVVRAHGAEAFLAGKRLDAATCAEAGRMAVADAAPIDDLRGSASYRCSTLAALVADALTRISVGRHAEGWMAPSVLLETQRESGQAMRTGSSSAPFDGAIATTINGREYTLDGEATRKTLLNALREDAGLTGTKEGCAEGECGACTVWLDGQAVMACLVPAAQAHGAHITTIEGLATTARATTECITAEGESAQRELHPLQRAFIESGAVQCGFCIPGMLMAGAKLLDEHPRPDLDQVRIALSGNICRCTGYRKILDAMLLAAREQTTETSALLSAEHEGVGARSASPAAGSVVSPSPRRAEVGTEGGA